MIKHVANQHKKTPSRLKVPWWIILIVTASILPVLSWPLYMRNFNFTADDTHELYLLLAYLFPVYIVLSGFPAYKCYPVRKEITYILIALMWLSYGAAFFLK